MELIFQSLSRVLDGHFTIAQALRKALFQSLSRVLGKAC